MLWASAASAGCYCFFFTALRNDEILLIKYWLASVSTQFFLCLSLLWVVHRFGYFSCCLFWSLIVIVKCLDAICAPAYVQYKIPLDSTRLEWFETDAFRSKRIEQCVFVYLFCIFYEIMFFSASREPLLAPPLTLEMKNASHNVHFEWIRLFQKNFLS